jgi:hypothetical protein
MGGKSSSTPKPVPQTVPGSKRDMLPEEKKAADDRMKMVAAANEANTIDADVMGDTSTVLGGL